MSNWLKVGQFYTNWSHLVLEATLLSTMQSCQCSSKIDVNSVKEPNCLGCLKNISPQKAVSSLSLGGQRPLWRPRQGIWSSTPTACASILWWACRPGPVGEFWLMKWVDVGYQTIPQFFQSLQVIYLSTPLLAHREDPGFLTENRATR